MIRIVVTTADAGMAANVGGPVQVRMRTFDIEHAELEAVLEEGSLGVAGYFQAHVAGVEVIKSKLAHQ